MWVTSFTPTVKISIYVGSFLTFYFVCPCVCVFMCLNRQLLVTVASLSPPLVVEISLNEVMPQSPNGCFLNLIYEVIP